MISFIRFIPSTMSEKVSCISSLFFRDGSRMATCMAVREKFRGLFISCSRPAVNEPSEFSFSLWTSWDWVSFRLLSVFSRSRFCTTRFFSNIAVCSRFFMRVKTSSLLNGLVKKSSAPFSSAVILTLSSARAVNNMILIAWVSLSSLSNLQTVNPSISGNIRSSSMISGLYFLASSRPFLPSRAWMML